MVTDPGVMTTFAIAALLLIMMPGPDQVLVTRNALSGGRRGGLLTMVGGALGLGVHATAAAVGLSALLLASSTAFTALKVVGVAYLLWLGVQTLAVRPADPRSSRPRRPDPRSGSAGRRTCARASSRTRSTPRSRCSSSPSCRSSCPRDSGSPRGDALLLSAVFAGLYVAWFGSYAVLVDRLGRGCAGRP